MLTQCKHDGMMVGMEQTEQQIHEATEVSARPKARSRNLPAKPIMIYPSSDEQRRLFEEAAAEENRKLSPFVVWAVSQYIEMKRAGLTATGRLEEARRRLSRIA